MVAIEYSKSALSSIFRRVIAVGALVFGFFTVYFGASLYVLKSHGLERLSGVAHADVPLADDYEGGRGGHEGGGSAGKGGGGGGKSSSGSGGSKSSGGGKSSGSSASGGGKSSGSSASGAGRSGGSSSGGKSCGPPGKSGSPGCGPPGGGSSGGGSGSKGGSSGGKSGGSSGACFAYSSPVRMADGSLKPIGEIRIGDMVMSFEGLGTLVASRVVTVFVHEDEVVVNLNGTHVTTAHRFLLTDGFYKPLGTIDPHEKLVAEDGSPISDWSLEVVPGTTRVYNLTVADTHTYVAGGFRVHNAK